MMDIISSGWFWTNIVAPLSLPIIGLLPLMLLPLGVPLRVMALVKDAQMCWGAVGMGAASFYEFWTASAAAKPISHLGILLGAILFLTFLATILAAGGSVFSTPLLGTPGGIIAWCKHYKAFIGSVALSALSAASYTALHFSL
jgi:hypothetical protein